MKSPVDRKTVDLTAYRDLVVIYLGMHIRILRGLLTMLGINKVVEPSHPRCMRSLRKGGKVACTLKKSVRQLPGGIRVRRRSR